MRSVLAGILFLFTAGPWQQAQSDPEPNWNIPPVVSRRLQAEGLLQRYEVSTRLNPFYLRGDLDGDGVPDYAVLVVNRATKAVGVAILRSRAPKIEVLGAGGVNLKIAPTEDGAESTKVDGFEWMDSWHIERRQHLQFTGLDKPVTQMVGEGIFVEKSEAASAMIYWDGKKYRWLQESD